MTDVANLRAAVTTEAEAEELQRHLEAQVDLTSALTGPPHVVAGLDVSYRQGSDDVAAAAVLIEVSSMRVVESSVVFGRVTFPYVPGLLGFREVPFLLDALSRLTTQPDVLMCDGYGIAHPRRFGLACHLGVVTGMPALGVAKTAFVTRFAPPPPGRGDWTPLTDDGETLGRALRTQTGVKPVFVSVGHRISLDEATDVVLATSPDYRIPEPTRQADHISRQALR